MVVFRLSLIWLREQIEPTTFGYWAPTSYQTASISRDLFSWLEAPFASQVCAYFYNIANYA